MKKALGILFLLLWTSLLFAQEITVTGKVTNRNDNSPIPGVNVIEKGTTNGTITNFEGEFTIKVQQGVVLLFSSIGMKPIEMAASATPMTIQMEEDVTDLTEVIVVGYGVQKKSVVTASIARVSAEDLSMTSPVRMDNALKGLASGVTVTSSSGQPGAAARVRIRGVGTINNSEPLYIVDGMPIEGGLDFLNPNDIASIEVLKDAASGAVYGARAANGVILVTTKTGKEGKTRVNYDYSMGWQRPWTQRDVLNASEYAVMMNEGAMNAGMPFKYNDPYSYGTGTNWQKAVFNNDAPVASHQMSLNGAGEKINYLFSAGFYTQEGIVGGNYDRSNYERFTMRSNNTYTLFDQSNKRNWLNTAKITSNVSYARVKSTGIEVNSTWGSPLGSALTLSPILSVYDEGAAAQAQLDKYAGNLDYSPVYDPNNGKLFMVPGTDYNEMVNPLAALSLPGVRGWSHKLVSNFSAELQLIDGLRFKSSYGADLAFWGSDSYTKLFYLSGNNKATKTSVSSSSSRGTVWQIENILMYDKSIGKHSLSLLAGQSAKQTRGYYLGGYRYGMIDPNGSKPYIDYANGLQENGDMFIYGGKQPYVTLASMFARASYNFEERYMLQATVRRDGSSRFGWNNHYAVFPSFSLGWNLTNEAFMEDRPQWLTSTKVRLSWGKNGNENIGNFRYTVMTASGNNYLFGSGENMAIGVKASGLANPDLKWEESEQLNFGLDFGFLANALTITTDYYIKRTNGMLMVMNIPSYVGESKPIGNVGDMENRGLEFEGSYKFKTGNWNFRIAGNLSYLQNELIEYGNETGWANLDAFQGTGTISRAQNGKPFPFFYGFKTNGVYQNQAELANAPTYWDGSAPIPGNVRYVDISGPDGTPDGIINDYDKTDIGKGMPDWTYGMNFTASWKNFDLNMMWQGTAGNSVFDATRRTDISASNLPSWMLNRWTGEGTSNRIPRFALGDNYNWQSSDLYVYDGSFLRLKNIQLGYTLPSALTKRALISSIKVYVAAENLLTFTKYHGFEPEISSGGTSLGIDYGVYPQAKTFTAGLNVAF
jgi:TonB-dependent starch-binding outer membrane protein SusC